jgi:hypothetical protein
MSEQQNTGRACQWYGAPDPDDDTGNGAELHLIRGEGAADASPEGAGDDSPWLAARGHYDPVRPGTHVAFNR